MYLACRYKLGSPSFRGGSVEISVEFWWSFPEAGSIPGTVLSTVFRGCSVEFFAEVLVKFPQGGTHRRCGPVKQALGKVYMSKGKRFQIPKVQQLSNMLLFVTNI